MKSFIFFFICALIAHTSFLSAQQPSSKANAQPALPVKLLTRADTIQYSLGAYIGQWFVKNGFNISNKALFQRGMDDALQSKKLAVNDTVIAPIVASYQISLQNARSKALEEQLFTSLKGRPGVGVLPDGVNYIVVKSGTGLRPAAKDTVVINAIGIFPDGTVFEDTYQKKQAITTLTSNLIPGLSEAVQLMPEGSTWRIFIPSVLAYGPAGLPNRIPPNMALVFDGNLVQVKTGW
jgi:FKBP-type peptidyl-prolyl cis-trans isomerase